MPRDRLSDGSRFRPVFAAVQFRADVVTQLARREDRTEYNLPRLLRDLRVIGERAAFMSGYVIETTGVRPAKAHVAVGADQLADALPVLDSESRR